MLPVRAQKKMRIVLLESGRKGTLVIQGRES